MHAMPRRAISDLRKYLMSLSVEDREAFAKRCETTAQHLINVSHGYKSCGESLAINIERESSGAVRCEKMRPDVDWQFLRNTA